MQPQSRAASRAPWVWFAVLALLVAGPLLGSGHILLLDFPSGPQFPRLSFLPLPSSGDVGNAIPIAAVHVVLRSIYPLLPEKLFFLGPIVLGGIGAARFVQKRLGAGLLPALYAGTVFVVNPFVYDRYTAGQLYILLAYALLPWGLSALVDAVQRPSGRTATALALWLAALAAIDLHVAGMFAMLVLVAAVVGRSWRLVAVAAGAFAVSALLWSYWLLPALFSAPGPQVGSADLEVYASRPHGFLVLPSLLGLHGFWRNEFAGAEQRIPLLNLLLVGIIGSAVTGAVLLWSSEEHRRWVLGLCVGAVLALFLAAGTSFPPTAAVFRWLFAHVPFFGAYREPQKFVAVLALAYAVLGAAGLDRALAKLRSPPARARAVRIAVGGVALAGVIAYSYPMLWGLWGQVGLSRYPDGWSAAERVMDGSDGGRLLVLPWNLYAVWSFTDGRIVANPAPSFFSADVISDKEAGFSKVPAQSPDSFSQYVTEILAHRDQVSAFGHLVAPLDVRYVALLHEVDWWQYRFLSRQQDLALLYRGPGIVLFSNQAWSGDPMGLFPGPPITRPSDLVGTGREMQVTSRLFLGPALAPPSEDSFPSVAEPLPVWRGIGTQRTPIVSTGDRCTDGWRLGNEAAGCQLGAVAAFPSPARTESLWRPLAGAWLIGYLVSGLTLLGVLLYRRRHRPRDLESTSGA